MGARRALAGAGGRAQVLLTTTHPTPCPPPILRRADQIQIQALVKWLGVRLTIVSVDAHALHTDVVEGGASPWCSLHVLLRPGHYDVLTARA